MFTVPPRRWPAGSTVAAWLRRLPAGVWQLVLLAVLLAGYEAGRYLAIADPAEARRNAEDVWNVERTLRLPNEAVLQSWVLELPGLIRFANHYYTWMHFPATAVFLLWVWRRRPVPVGEGDTVRYRHRAGWPLARAALVVSTAAALLIQVCYPLAPPRMLSGHGLVDTGLRFGPSPYSGGPSSGLANQLAAMPSLHVGWAVLVGIGAVLLSRSRWRWIALAHPVLTTMAVVVTANHYWLDGAVGTALVAAGWWSVGRLNRFRREAAEVSGQPSAAASVPGVTARSGPGSPCARRLHPSSPCAPPAVTGRSGRQCRPVPASRARPASGRSSGT